MYSPRTVPTFQLQTELANGHYLNFHHGMLCYGEKLKSGVLRVQNAKLQTDAEAQHLVELITDIKDPVGAVKLFLMHAKDLKSEIVLGPVCTTALWCSKNLANFKELRLVASPTLHGINQALKFYRYSSGESFPETLPLARIPDFQEFAQRARMVFYHSEATGTSASRYCYCPTHEQAVNSLIAERKACGVETKSYELLNSSFIYLEEKRLLHVFMPRNWFSVEMEDQCLSHFQKVMNIIDPEIQVHLEFTDHCIF